MANVNSLEESLQAIVKDRYADKFEKARPEYSFLTSLVPFKESERIGKKFVFPVALTRLKGATHAGPNSGAFALKDPIAFQTRPAEVDGYNLVMRGPIDYETAAKATANNKASFYSSSDMVVEEMLEGSTYYNECSLFHGQDGLGVIDTVAGVTATTATVTLDEATWADYIWCFGEEETIDVYTPAGVLIAGPFTVETVDPTTYTIGVSGLAANITTLVASGATGVIYFEGAFGQEMAGIAKIMKNTGVLFGIDAAQFGAWKGTQHDVGGADLTTIEIFKGISKGVGKGLKGSGELAVNPATWERLNDSISVGNRAFDASYQTTVAETGAEAIKLHCQTGTLTVHSCAWVKRGQAFFFQKDNLCRPGATETTMKIPGGDQMVFHMPANAGYELRTYSNFGIAAKKPARLVYYTNIVNS